MFSPLTCQALRSQGVTSQAHVLFSEQNVKLRWTQSGAQGQVDGVRLILAQCGERECMSRCVLDWSLTYKLIDFLAVCNETAAPPYFAQPIKLPESRLVVTSDEVR